MRSRIMSNILNIIPSLRFGKMICEFSVPEVFMAGPSSPRSRGENRRGNDSERRIDLNDGNAYCEANFLARYGGSREWEMSPRHGEALALTVTTQVSRYRNRVDFGC